MEDLNNSYLNKLRFIEAEGLLFDQSLTISPENRKKLHNYGLHCLKSERYMTAVEAFQKLHDFPMLKKIKDLIPENKRTEYFFCYLSLLESLENYEEIESFIEKLDQEKIDGFFSFEDFRKAIYQKALSLPAKKGKELSGTTNNSDILAIYKLAKEYDIAIAIANGGLFQGAIAAFLGMPLKVLAISAHNQQNIKTEWLDPISREDLAGKRVLLFDKDVISGATVRSAFEIMRHFAVSKIGLYLSIRPSSSPYGLGSHLESIPAGIEVYYPGNVSLKDAGEALTKFHLAVKTNRGRKLLLEQEAERVQNTLEQESLELSIHWKEYVDSQLELYESLDKSIPGTDQIRRMILNRYESLREIMLLSVIQTKNKLDVLRSTGFFPENIVEVFMMARYCQEAKRLANKRSTENNHIPANILSAFQTAASLELRNYHYALIVGPEGFAYEAIFNELGLKSLAINIPESEAGGQRTLSYLDPMPDLKGKRILIVEDDVRTGATLRKILNDPGLSQAKSFDLYLGQEPRFQRLEKVPTAIKYVFLAGQHYGKKKPKCFLDHLKSMDQSIFRNDKK